MKLLNIEQLLDKRERAIYTRELLDKKVTLISKEGEKATYNIKSSQWLELAKKEYDNEISEINAQISYLDNSGEETVNIHGDAWRVCELSDNKTEESTAQKNVCSSDVIDTLIRLISVSSDALNKFLK